jgi:hypothetical protein
MDLDPSRSVADNRSSRPGASYAGTVATGELEVLAWLPEPIHVHRTLAGRSYEVRIQDWRIGLTLPLEGPDATPFGEPDKPRAIRAFPPPPLPEGFTPKVFTYASVSLPVHEKVLAVDVVRLRWRDEALAISRNELGGSDPFINAFDDWLNAVYDWLTAWSGNVRTPIERRPRPVVLIASQDDPAAPARGGGGTIPVLVQGQRAFNPAEVRGAFAAASRAIPVPLEHRLLAEAVMHVHRDEHRQAAISACSAAEVALAAESRHLLIRAGRSHDEAASILKGVRGVVELYRLSAARRRGLPVSIGRVMDQLAAPRNDAVHGGKDIVEDAAIAAVRTARELVQAVSRLPAPRSAAIVGSPAD